MAIATTTSGVGAGPSLREAQVSSLLSLLNFNTPVAASQVQATASNVSTSGTSAAAAAAVSAANNANAAAAGRAGGPPQLPPGPSIWKVLIMDKTSQDILATSLRVQDLRDHGVTLHL